MGKRGFMYTLFIVLILTLLTLNFQVQRKGNSLVDQSTLYLGRVTSTNEFLEDVLADFDRTLATSARQAFKSAEAYGWDTGNYLTDASVQIPILMKNGTIEDRSMNLSNESTLQLWAIAVVNVSEKFGIGLNFSNFSVEIVESGPFEINITGVMNVSMVDLYSGTRWNFTHTGKIVLNISGLPDMLYVIEGATNYENHLGVPPPQPMRSVVRQTPYLTWWTNQTAFIYPLNINVTRLTDHIESQFYRANTNAPSYLMRLEGDFGSSPYGIESFVNTTSVVWVPEFGVDNDPMQSCMVDYQYFASGCGFIFNNPHKIHNVIATFFVDENTMLFYNFSKTNST